MTPAASLRVALAQASPVPGDVEANVRAAGTLIAHAAERGAHLVVFPELFLTGYDLPHLTATRTAWIDEDDGRLNPVRRMCAVRGVTAVLGAALRTREGAGFIVAPVIGPKGDLGMSQKQHVHDSEAQLFRCGVPSPPFDVRGWRVSVAICFDAAVPRHAESAARAGADLYVVSALYTRGEERRSDLHLGARAMDNRIFTVLANYAGTTGGHASCGLSGAWGPSGEVLARVAEATETVLMVDLDPVELARYRAK